MLIPINAPAKPVTAAIYQLQKLIAGLAGQTPALMIKIIFFFLLNK
jgi:hypothetical protein